MQREDTNADPLMLDLVQNMVTAPPRAKAVNGIGPGAGKGARERAVERELRRVRARDGIRRCIFRGHWRAVYDATSDARTHPDLNTVAYLALGAKAAIRNARNSNSRLLDAALAGVGENGLISDVVQHALLLDQTADEAGNDFDAVFDYEVAETFGEEYADSIIYGRPFDAQTRARELVAAIAHN